MPGKIGHQIGNYHLVSLLGCGGFACVYLAENIYTREIQVAIKIANAIITLEELAAFKLEAEIIARLRHPHIIRILDFGIELGDSTPYLIMDYAPQGMLRHRHPRGNIVPPDTIAAYVKQIAEALQYAHDHNLIHRDLKPENLLVGNDGKILLSDSGIAALVHHTATMQTAPFEGTVPYSAPEQIRGQPRRESDQYSLGIIVYEWLTGERPFRGSMTEIIFQHLGSLPPPLHEKLPGLPPRVRVRVEEVVMRALAKDPHQRFDSVQEFADRFEKALISPNPPMPITRRKVVVDLAGLAIVGMAGSGLVWLAHSLSPSAPAAPASPTVSPTPASTPTPTLSPTPASTPSPPSPQAIYTQVTSGTPTISDPLTGEDNFDWEMFNAGQGGGGSSGYTCAFTQGAYHSSVQAGGNFNHCLARATNFSNFALQVQMTIIHGPSGRLLFRSNLAQGYFYAFSISTDGAYFLKMISPASIAGKIQTTTLISGSSLAINQGANQSNTLTVVTQGNTFYLYVNGQYVDNASDSTLTSGAIGVFTLGAEAAFSNLKVWKLP